MPQTGWPTWFGDDEWRAWPAPAPVPPGFGVPPVSFPGAQLRIRVEIMLGGAWVDVSTRVLYDYRIKIRRGRRPGQRKTTAAQMTLTFRNDDQWMSPRNAAGPWFGLLRQNTPIRAYLNPGSGDSLRFTGKIPGWVPGAYGHPRERRVTVIAYGVRNRLTRPNSPPFDSAQKRYIGSAVNAPVVLQYRSLEDGDFPARITGPPGSAPLPDLSRGGVASDNVPSGWTTGGGVSWAVECDALYPLGAEVAGGPAAALRWDTAGTIGSWRIADDGTGIGIVYFTAADGIRHTALSAINAYDGLWHHYRCEATQNGTGIDVALFQDGVSIMTTTFASSTLERPFFWLVQDDSPGFGAARMPAVGHVVVWLTKIYGSSSYRAFTGWTGETPAERWLRIGAEEGLDVVVDELTTDQILMGPQQRRTLTQLLVDCEDAAEGLIDETFANELRLSTLRSRYNREVRLSIDYGAGQILPPLLPGDDDDELINRWTLNRPDGGERTYERTTGPLNSADPEDDQNGVGLYDQAEEVNLADDDALYVSAGWRVHRDTVDEPRYPSIRFELAAHPDLIPGWLSCDIGSRVLIRSGPDDVGLDDPDEILEGYEESFDQVSWDVDAFLSPASVYMVADVAPSGGYGPEEPRLDCSASVLAASLAADPAGVTDDMEDGVAAWSPTGGTFVSSSAVPGYVGTLTGLLTTTGAPAQTYTRREVAVTAGSSYSVSVWCYSAAGYASVLAAIDWYTGPGATGYLSTTTGSTTALAAATWEQRIATGAAPAGAAYAQFGPTLAGSPVAGTLLSVDHAQWLAVFTVNILDTCVWTHAYGDYPIVIDGEEMCLTSAAAAGGAYPAQTQVLSVLRGVNGPPIAHTAGNAVHVRNPIILAR